MMGDSAIARFAMALPAVGAAPTDSSGLTSTGLTSFEFARLQQFEDPRIVWAIAAAAALLLASLVAWQYRRESDSLPWGMGAVLAALRLTALLAALLFYLAPTKRTDQQIVEQSRAVVLVDASQSMTIEDEPGAAGAAQRRSDAVASFLENSSLLAELNREHDVSVLAFDASTRRLARWRRFTGGADESPHGENVDAHSTGAGESPTGADSDSAGASAGEAASELQSNSRNAIAPSEAGTWLTQLIPIGTETRLGDAVLAILNDGAGGPLAGIVAVTDGRQTSGLDPVDAAEVAGASQVPIFTLGVGSTEPRRNVRLQELAAPSRAYPDDKVAIRALVFAEGMQGRDVELQLYVGEMQGAAPSATMLVESRRISFNSASETVPLEFELEPTEPGRLSIEAKVIAPDGDQFPSDDSRREEIEVIESSSRVLLVASAATRDYRFLRNQLRRDRHTTVDVLLQMASPGISQDADAILDQFPRTSEALFQYDCIVAFDPDWTQLDAEQVELLERWVAEEAGGMIVVAGPIHTSALVQSAEHASVRSLYPVEFQRRLTLLDDGVFGSKTPWPIELTSDGQQAEYLQLADTPEASRAMWIEFPGVYGCYAVKGPKPGARVLGRFSDPEAGLSMERPVYFAEQFYGAGRVFYMGSGELWRLRSLDPKYFEVLYTQLIRHVSQGRLLRGSSLGYLLVERDRYDTGDTVEIRAELKASNREPYVAPRVTARVVDPDGAGRNVSLEADETRPGSFRGQFAVSNQGVHRIELSIPEAVDQQLVRRIEVVAPDLEFRQTRRDEKALAEMARLTDGRYYESLESSIEGSGDAPPLPSLLKSRAETRIQRGKPDQQFAERLNKVLLIVICATLSGEWFLRRLMKLA